MIKRVRIPIRKNQKDSPIRKIETGKVRKLILELENPTESQSGKVELDKKKRVSVKKDSVLSNQARITKLFKNE